MVALSVDSGAEGEISRPVLSPLIENSCVRVTDTNEPKAVSKRRAIQKAWRQCRKSHRLSAAMGWLTRLDKQAP
jgi:hypothetical protein